MNEHDIITAIEAAKHQESTIEGTLTLCTHAGKSAFIRCWFETDQKAEEFLRKVENTAKGFLSYGATAGAEGFPRVEMRFEFNTAQEAELFVSILERQANKKGTI